MIVGQHRRRHLERDILTFTLSPKGCLRTGGVRVHLRCPELYLSSKMKVANGSVLHIVAGREPLRVPENTVLKSNPLILMLFNTEYNQMEKRTNNLTIKQHCYNYVIL